MNILFSISLQLIVLIAVIYSIFLYPQVPIIYTSLFVLFLYYIAFKNAFGLIELVKTTFYKLADDFFERAETENISIEKYVEDVKKGNVN